jgi:pimeloyl-ACP methyl ester carboxylesterase
MNGFIYVAAGIQPHPTVLILHGSPGNEQNLDPAQALRRAGYNVLFFHYRGSWGSPGKFTQAGGVDDGQAAVAAAVLIARGVRRKTHPSADEG